MSEPLISDVDRQQQQLQSAQDSSNEEAPAPVPVTEPAVTPEAGEVEIPDDEPVLAEDDDGVMLLDEDAPLSLSTILSNIADENGIVTTRVRPSMKFVINLSKDETHDALMNIGSFESEGQKYNLIQPLTKYNDKSGRIGVLRESLATFVDTLQGLFDVSAVIAAPIETVESVLDSLAQEMIAQAETSLYSVFPRLDDEPIVPFGDDYLPAHEFLFSHALSQFTQDGNVHVVNLNFVLHLRVPLLVAPGKEASFEKNLRSHVKYLEKLGIAKNIDTEVAVSFTASDLLDEQILAAFTWLRENAASTPEVLSFSNLEDAPDYINVHGFTVNNYRDALLNNADFVVFFELTQGSAE